MGHLRPGTADGYLQSHKLENIATLIYPLPDSISRIGYTLQPGVTIILTELIGVPSVPPPLAPYDRTPVDIQLNGFQIAAASSGTVDLATYTVPAAHILQLSHMNVRAMRQTAGTSAGNTQILALVNGVQLLGTLSPVNVVGDQHSESLSGGPLYLTAGATIRVYIVQAENGGSLYCWGSLAGLLFTA